MSARAWTDAQLREVHGWRQEGRTWAWIGAQAGVPPQQAKERYSRARTRGLLDRVLGGEVTEPETVTTGERMEWKQTGDGAELWSRSSRIRTLDALLVAADVDLTRWTVKWHTINKWEVGAKQDGRILTEELWQVKATLKAIPGAAEARAVVADLIADMDSHAPRYQPVAYVTAGPERHMVLVSMADHHIGGLVWWQEAGASWDAEIAEKLAAEAMADVLAKAEPYQPERLTILVGNDWFHTDRTIDGKGGTTARGTVQETDGRWQRVFRVGTRAAVGMIDAARGLAPVTVQVRPGNHDEQTGFMLGDLLGAWYRNDNDVTVLNDPAPRVYDRYGVTLLGYAHGHNEKPAKLPMLMASEAPRLWAETVFREWIVGHRHRAAILKDEESGVQTHTMPSLCADDDYAVRMGLRHRRSCEARVYHHDTGPAAHLIFNARSDA